MEPFKKSPVTKAYSTSSSGNTNHEIKSHSSLLSNERIAILFYMLDVSSINLNTVYDQQYLNRTKAILYQLYKNVRTLIRNNSVIRIKLNLETKEPGIYTIDVAFDIVDKMIMYCTFNGYTYKRCYAIAQQLNYIETEIREVLQYFKYFFRQEYKQKPDVVIATEKYKDLIDKNTLNQLREVIGKKNKIDFDKLEEDVVFEDDETNKLVDYEELEDDDDGNDD